jgi:hypothetical protein
MEEPYTQPATTSSRPLPAAAIVAGMGGLVALIGVFLSWATLTSSFEGFRGDQVGVAGRFHWIGILALVAAVVTIAASIAMVVLQEAASRRAAAVAALAGGAGAVLIAILGIVMSESIVLSRVPRGAIDFRRALAEQLGVEGFGIDTGPSIGVFVTALGGAAAAVGGFMALRHAGRQPISPAYEPAPGMGFEGPEVGPNPPPPEGPPGPEGSTA